MAKSKKKAKTFPETVKANIQTARADLEKEFKDVVDKLQANRKLTQKEVEKRIKTLQKSASSRIKELEKALDDAIRSAYNVVNLPTRDEVEKISKKVGKMAKDLEKISTTLEPKKAKKAVKKKAVAKKKTTVKKATKAAPKKTAAKKATAKKPAAKKTTRKAAKKK